MEVGRGEGGGRALPPFLGTPNGGRGLSLGGEITLTLTGVEGRASLSKRLERSGSARYIVVGRCKHFRDAQVQSINQSFRTIDLLGFWFIFFVYLSC